MTRPTNRPHPALAAAAIAVAGFAASAAASEPIGFEHAVAAATSTTAAPSTSTESTLAGKERDGGRFDLVTPSTPVPTTATTIATTSTSAGVLDEARAAPGTPPQLAPRGAGVPVGKGMWIWLPEQADGGDPHAIVARAQSVGLTHIYVRTGSSRSGVQATAFLEALLPLAHDAGIRVYGWDFPYLEDVAGDVERALAAITFRTTTGHRIDGFVPDIETNAEGTNLTAEAAAAYSQALRAAVGDDYPLIACVPHPSPQRQATFPYAAIIPHFDAVAPMSYWLNRQPEGDAQLAVSWLSQFGKPVIPVGQAYDGAPEGGRPGPPPADEIRRFMAAAQQAGATAVSFWSWQHATPEIWNAIAEAPELTIPRDDSQLGREQLLAVQTQLSSMGYWAPPTGVWDEQTVHAVTVFQIDLGLHPTGQLDAATRAGLLGPLAPPVRRSR